LLCLSVNVVLIGRFFAIWTALKIAFDKVYDAGFANASMETLIKNNTWFFTITNGTFMVDVFLVGLRLVFIILIFVLGKINLWVLINLEGFLNIQIINIDLSFNDFSIDDFFHVNNQSFLKNYLIGKMKNV
jgi:hypothetical protein